MSPVRVVFVTQEDPFYIAEFFRAFLGDARMRTGVVDLVGAHVLDTLGESGQLGLLRKMHGLYGAAGVLRLAGRYARKLALSRLHDALGIGEPVRVEQLLRRAGVPVWKTAHVNAPSVLAQIASLAPDVLFSISATQKFGPELLRLAPRGCFNSHSGALPRFRGMMPTFWTLFEGEPVATVTVHRMAERIDAGEIWRQGTIPIAPEASLDDVIRETKRLSARMMWELSEALAIGPVPLYANEEAGKSYYRFPTAAHSRELRRRGRRLL